MPRTKSTITPFGSIESRKNSESGNNDFASHCDNPYISGMPSKVPRAPISDVSVRICITRRPREAPRAPRTENSLSRARCEPATEPQDSHTRLPAPIARATAEVPEDRQSDVAGNVNPVAPGNYAEMIPLRLLCGSCPNNHLVGTFAKNARAIMSATPPLAARVRILHPLAAPLR